MTLYRNPWARVDAWRNHPIFSRTAMFRGAFPGLGIATVAFTIYCVGEYVMESNQSHGSSAVKEHGEKH
ncbi:NADH-ubiquinone oxidoreductase B12 subunit family-domain-containing protein [Paraphysoderma sedebokerense]|nr:NADH-ubiquinone oxidoreductase B12 subunit family-domain-containing protein [Paraphysoderma sedebokerense]